MCTGPAPATPAAVTTPSTRPKRWTVAATSRSTAASSVTSVSRNSHRALAVTPAGCATSAPITWAPSSSNRSAVARPIPDAAPVMMTVLSRSPRTVCPLLSELNTMIEVVQMSSQTLAEANGRGTARRANEERILDAAERCMSRFGLHRFSMADVAAHSGLSRGSIYLYFKDRPSLVDAALARMATRVRLEQRARRAPPPQPGGPGRGGGRVHPGAPRRPTPRAPPPGRPGKPDRHPHDGADGAPGGGVGRLLVTLSRGRRSGAARSGRSIVARRASGSSG